MYNYGNLVIEGGNFYVGNDPTISNQTQSYHEIDNELVKYKIWLYDNRGNVIAGSLDEVKKEIKRIKQLDIVKKIVEYSASNPNIRIMLSIKMLNDKKDIEITPSINNLKSDKECEYIEIPKYIKEIDNGAFSLCKCNIKIKAENLEYIGDAFCARKYNNETGKYQRYLGQEVDISEVNTTKLTSRMNNLFENCINIKRVVLPCIDIAKVDIDGIVAGCRSLEEIDISKVNFTHDKALKKALTYAYSNPFVDIEEDKVENSSSFIVKVSKHNYNEAMTMLHNEEQAGYKIIERKENEDIDRKRILNRVRTLSNCTGVIIVEQIDDTI